MSDIPPKPPAVPAPTGLQRIFTALLPQFIAYSRKGLVWFCALGAGGVAELAKQAGDYFGWTPEHVLRFNNEMLLFQGVLLLVAKFWTDQIAHEDAALKTGLPPPSAVVIQGAPPAPPKGEGD